MMSLLCCSRYSWVHTLDQVAKGESALGPLAIDETTRGVEPRLPLLRRGGAGDALLSHVSSVSRSTVQTALDLDEWVDVKVERLQDLYRNGESLPSERLDVAVHPLFVVVFVWPSVLREAVWLLVVEGRDLDVVTDWHLPCRGWVGVYRGVAEEEDWAWMGNRIRPMCRCECVLSRANGERGSQ
jgi:hypothetical protein